MDTVKPNDNSSKFYKRKVKVTIWGKKKKTDIVLTFLDKIILELSSGKQILTP